jgi:hypothetical protein
MQRLAVTPWQTFKNSLTRARQHHLGSTGLSAVRVVSCDTLRLLRGGSGPLTGGSSPALDGAATARAPPGRHFPEELR